MASSCDMIAKGNDVYISCKNADGAFENFQVINQGTIQLICKTDSQALSALATRVTNLEGDINSVRVQYSSLLSLINQNATDYRDLNNMPLSDTAQLVQKADYDALSNTVAILQNGTFSLKNCAGGVIQRGGAVPDCAEFNNLVSEVEGIDGRLTVIQQQLGSSGGAVTNLTQRVVVLETQMASVLDRLNALTNTEAAHHQEVIRRLEALESGSGGSGGSVAGSIRWRQEPVPATTDQLRYGVPYSKYVLDNPGSSSQEMDSRGISLNKLEILSGGQWVEVPFVNNTQAQVVITGQNY